MSVGSHKLESQHQHRIKSIHKHPNYNKENHDFDIALLTLHNPLVFSKKIKAVKLPSRSLKVKAGDKAMVTGFGATLKPKKPISNDLRKIVIEIVDFKKCKKLYPTPLTKNMICGSTNGGKQDSCTGDSGGPMVLLNGTLIGLVSFGHECADKVYPGVYTNVPVLLDFIKEKM